MDVFIGNEMSRAAVSTSTALVAESTDLISSNALGSRSVFGETMSETVFSSVFGATPSENAATRNAEAGSTATVVEKDLSQFNPASFMATLHLMEKAIVGNTYEKRLLAYRDVQDAEVLEEKRIQIISQQERLSDDNNMTSNDYLAAAAATEMQLDKQDVDGPGAQALRLLWSYRCELTRGRNVCYTALNKANEVWTKLFFQQYLG